MDKINTEVWLTEEGVKLRFRDDDSTVVLTWWQFAKFALMHPALLCANPELIKAVWWFHATRAPRHGI